VARLVQHPAPDRRRSGRGRRRRPGRSWRSLARIGCTLCSWVALGLGLRRGELLRLRWQDVDFASGQLRVWHTLVRVRGAGVVFGPPKSRRSRRVLTMPAFVVQALKAHRDRQADERKAAAEKWFES
jgi:integrase